MCARRPPAHIYRWEGEGRGQGAPQVGSNPTWAPTHAPPVPYLLEGEGKRGRGKEGGVLLHTFLSLPLFPSPPRPACYGGAPAPCGLVCSLSWPIRPISLPGCPILLSGDPISTWYRPKHFRCPNTIVLYINLTYRPF